MEASKSTYRLLGKQVSADEFHQFKSNLLLQKSPEIISDDLNGNISLGASS
jgi:hypothetical protein